MTKGADGHPHPTHVDAEPTVSRRRVAAGLRAQGLRGAPFALY